MSPDVTACALHRLSANNVLIRLEEEIRGKTSVIESFFLPRDLAAPALALAFPAQPANYIAQQCPVVGFTI
jgi:hypothetical protein